MATATNGANLGFENELWRAGDALRSNMDAAEYKHVVLGLVFLKYISDAFAEHHSNRSATLPTPSTKPPTSTKSATLPTPSTEPPTSTKSISSIESMPSIPALYAVVPGFCKSATLEENRLHNQILTPGRYVGAAEVEDDGEPFDQKMARLTAELREQFA